MEQKVQVGGQRVKRTSNPTEDVSYQKELEITIHEKTFILCQRNFEKIHTLYKQEEIETKKCLQPNSSSSRSTSTTNVHAQLMTQSMYTPSPTNRRSAEREVDPAKKRSTSATGLNKSSEGKPSRSAVLRTLDGCPRSGTPSAVGLPKAKGLPKVDDDDDDGM